MRRIIMGSLLGISVLTLALQLLGGWHANQVVTQAAAHGQAIDRPAIGFAVMITAALSSLLGLYITALRKQWRWFLLVLFTSFIGTAVYSVVQMVRPASQQNQTASINEMTSLS